SLSHPYPLLFNDTPPTDIYTLSLHDALPISPANAPRGSTARTVSAAIRSPTCSSSASAQASTRRSSRASTSGSPSTRRRYARRRSEEHTSELQSLTNLVCRLLLEKKKNEQHY